MSMAMSFIASALALLLLVLSVFLVVLWRGFREGASWLGSGASLDAQAVTTNAQFYRDQLAELDQEYQLGQLSDVQLKAAQEDVARRVLEDVTHTSTSTADIQPASKQRLWLVSALLALVLPIGAVSLYAVWGQPQALDPVALQHGLEPDAVTPEKLQQMVTALTRRLQDEPNSVEGWVLLGRVQRALAHFDEADEAFSHALQLSQDDDLKIERAEVLAQKNQGSFAGEPWQMIQQVLNVNPNHVNALLLAGSASFSELNYRVALRFWERAREVVAADSPDAASLDEAIAQARDKLGLPAAPAHAKASAEKALPTQSVSGRVSLVAELAAKVSPKDTVFVYATRVSGSRMPLAIIKTTVDQLPLDFVLDDSHAMRPDAKLSSLQEVSVTARISKSGQAIPQPGDWSVTLSPVRLGSRGLNLMIREPTN